MTATLPNRIAGLFPAPEPIVVPETPTERKAAYEEAILAAVLYYARRLGDRDAAAAERAAGALLALESTRIRHGRKVAGTFDDDFDAPLKPLAPIPTDAHPDDEIVDGDDDAIEEFDDADGDEIDVEPTRTAARACFTPNQRDAIEAAFANFTAARDENERQLRDEDASARDNEIIILDGPARSVPFPRWGADRWPADPVKTETPAKL